MLNQRGQEMKYWNLAKMVLSTICITTVTPALAQSEDAAPPMEQADQAKWSVTITPRLQKVFFQPGGSSDIKSMGTLGASVTVRNPDNRFGITGTIMSGNGKGNYDFNGGSTAVGGAPNNYAYELKRREFALQLEYTPRETGVTFIGGYHRFDIKNPESLTNARPGNSEVNFLRNKISAAEIGLRLASRLGAESKHAVSAQLMLGVGKGRFTLDQREVFRPFTNTNSINAKKTGYLADFALGYNYFLSRRISLGTRARAYVIYVSHPDSDPVFAVVPEFNISFRI